MNAADYKRLRSLFDEASSLPSEERESFLAGRCGEDLALQDQLRRMLAHDEAPRSMLTALPVMESDEEELAPGAIAVPGYAIRRVIGEGGFGVVYEAEQTQPVHRIVALKLIKHGSFSATGKSRFTIECEALARLDHPSIARVYDAGTTPTGHLFCAMEFIDGTSIVAFANEHRLTAVQRIEMMITVCEAAQHAHQRGILHRDLKPSNILVTRVDGRAIPKIIDFGIAKVRDEHGQGGGGPTLSGEFVGTPIYMSPEQADPARSEFDTRSDVYSLAVVLYELLTGTTPLQATRMAHLGLEGMLRSLRQDDVPLASARLRDLGADAERHAQRCSSKRETLLRLLQGDLDRVLAMALEKDRARRYESPQQFGADLARWLRNDAVIAQSPTTTYLLRKFARRHRGKLAVGASALVLLVGGVVGTTIGLMRAREEAWTSGANESYLNNDLLASVSPEGMGTADVTLLEILDNASRRLDGRFDERPIVEIALRTTLGSNYRSLGRSEPCQHHIEKACLLAKQHLDPDDPRRLRALRELGAARYIAGRYAEAEPLLREALDRSVRVLGEENEESIAAAFHLASVYGEHPDQQQARALVDHWLPISRARLGEAHPQTIQFSFGLGHILVANGEVDAALELFENTLGRARAELGATDRLTLLLTLEVARLKMARGAKAEAEQILRKAAAESTVRLGTRHPTTLNIRTQLWGLLQEDAKDLVEADRLLDELLDLWQKELPVGHPTLTTFLRDAGVHMASRGPEEQVRGLLEKLVIALADSPSAILLRALENLAVLAERRGASAEAQTWRERRAQVAARLPAEQKR